MSACTVFLSHSKCTVLSYKYLSGYITRALIGRLSVRWYITRAVIGRLSVLHEARLKHDYVTNSCFLLGLKCENCLSFRIVHSVLMVTIPFSAFSFADCGIFS